MKNFKLILSAVGVFAIVGSTMAVKRSTVQLYKAPSQTSNICNVATIVVDPNPVITDTKARLGAPGICTTVQYDFEP